MSKVEVLKFNKGSLAPFVTVIDTIKKGYSSRAIATIDNGVTIEPVSDKESQRGYMKIKKDNRTYIFDRLLHTVTFNDDPKTAIYYIPEPIGEMIIVPSVDFDSPTWGSLYNLGYGTEEFNGMMNIAFRKAYNEVISNLEANGFPTDLKYQDELEEWFDSFLSNRKPYEIGITISEWYSRILQILVKRTPNHIRSNIVINLEVKYILRGMISKKIQQLTDDIQKAILYDVYNTTDNISGDVDYTPEYITFESLIGFKPKVQELKDDFFHELYGVMVSIPITHYTMTHEEVADRIDQFKTAFVEKAKEELKKPKYKLYGKYDLRFTRMIFTTDYILEIEFHVCHKC